MYCPTIVWDVQVVVRVPNMAVEEKGYDCVRLGSSPNHKDNTFRQVLVTRLEDM